MKYELHPHQEDALVKMHNGCVLAGDVGTGKTFTALSYAALTEPGKHIYVITTAKKRDAGDWLKEAALVDIDADLFHVDSWNNISKYATVEDALFILDEQRLVGTGAWTRSFYQIAAKNRWILLSATPGDVWMDYAPVFIANGFFKNITEFRNKHVVMDPWSKYPKVKKYLGEGRLMAMRRAILVQMPMARHTTRHVEWVEVEHDQRLVDLVWKQRWNFYEEEPIKDAGELFRVGRKLVGSDPSRLEKVRHLQKQHPKLIVFYNFDYELEALRTLADEVPVAEWNGHKHQDIPDTDEWIYLVQYLSGSEGWNCTSTDAMVFYSLTYSYKQFWQAQGRIDRMNTPFVDLFYYVLMSNTVFDKAVKKSIDEKKDFNARGFM